MNEDAASSSSPSSTSTAIDHNDSPRFIILMTIWLVIATVWMRSVQWVQNHLASRKADPRIWTLVALLVPIAGAAAYAAFMKLNGRTLSTESLPNSKMPRRDPARSRPKSPFARSTKVPVAEIVSKTRTPRGFEFVDATKHFTAGDAALIPKLKKAGEMLDEALFEHANDVHIEPTYDDYRVRFRLNGLLQERMRYEKADGRLVLAALKKISGLDTKEENKPQEGRFQMETEERKVDLRISTTSSFQGEKVFIRLLDHSQSGYSLSSLGMDEKSLDIFTDILQARNGAILATGPSGSGKTSTLYAALRTMNVKRLNIMTIEDPPEYELPETTQLTVNPETGITYESGMQSIMRQNPDVILVGEIREAHTVKTALSAVIGGHLVLSSFNSLGALATITKFREMGIENYQIASAVRLILCQRLVRVLCQRCRHPFPATGSELVSLGLQIDPGAILYAATGCEHCMDIGFYGQEGVFEMLVIDETLRKAIADGADEDALADIASSKGFHSFHYSGGQKVLAGITTVEELLKTE